MYINCSDNIYVKYILFLYGPSPDSFSYIFGNTGL